EQGGRIQRREWAAIALGIAGAGRRPTSDGAAAALASRMDELKDPEHRAAIALALGLRPHVPSAAPIRALLDEAEIDDFPGFFVVALALPDAPGASALLENRARASTRRPALQEQLAVALGVCGQREVIPTLLEIVAASPQSGTIAPCLAAAEALGRIGDASAAE